MKKNNIGVLVIMIILLCIFLPGAIYGTYMHYKGGALGGNPNKDFYYNGKLYFYDNDNLLGTYTCINPSCGYATNSINNNYEFEIYNTEETEIKMINNRFAFIKDGGKINFYDIKTGTTIIEYAEIKNYAVGINGDYYILKNIDGKWGMLKILESASVAIPFQYDYLGLLNNQNNSQIDSSKIIAHDATGWKLLNSTNNVIATTVDEIVNYSNDFIVTKNNGAYKIFDYSNAEIMANYNINRVLLLDKLAIATISNGFYVIYNAATNNIIKSLAIPDNGEYAFRIENNSLVISQADRIIETIALS